MSTAALTFVYKGILLFPFTPLLRNPYFVPKAQILSVCLLTTGHFMQLEQSRSDSNNPTLFHA